jgi:hypothetical protein
LLVNFGRAGLRHAVNCANDRARFPSSDSDQQPSIIAVPKGLYRIGRSRAGLGLFATRDIRKRAYIVTYRGRRIRNEEADRLEASGSRYMFEINSRWTIDGSRRWNVARYVNHSCRPNAEAVERNRGIKYVARRRIKAGEEITVDYGKDYFSAFIGKKKCRCDKCRERRRADRQRLKRRKLRRLKAKRRRGRHSARR